ncbi:preprotein translocase subunit SecG [Micavibrio aeruginosavorus]|uniref:Protein-export membrane protein SecG n=1 Tax=Micavibrio aeruginosavorus (strain ARL-13) TaxID=856793 RepID=G2KSN6_MICAA|nr:preprotein translocase subunit SecG [Micavibrio aeruginosavorus]AEP09636.1 preprotein translocase, SecG subunit [Micavibrio aeruginosavorus ARL-13]
MIQVVLVIHLILALAIIGLVLIQRSEGGGLGIGGGGGGIGGLASPGATANALSRATAICAGCFFVTSLVLGILANASTSKGSILDRLDEPAAASAPAEAGADDEAEKKADKDTPPAEPSVPVAQ